MSTDHEFDSLAAGSPQAAAATSAAAGLAAASLGRDSASLPLAAFGYLNPLIAAAAMALSDVTVIGNALLLRRTKID